MEGKGCFCFLLCSLSDSLWLMNSLSSQDPPQTGAQLRSGNYTYLWLLEMPVLIIIKNSRSVKENRSRGDRCISSLIYSKCQGVFTNVWGIYCLS